MNQLMQYIDLPPQQAPKDGSRKFVGDIAAGYDAKREESPKWQIEQRIIEEMLSDLPAGTVVLDCPVGTGRFLDTYIANGFPFIGIDRSGPSTAEPGIPTMLELASQKADAIIKRLGLTGKVRGMLQEGDILNLALKAKSVDVAVCCRITRWVMGDHGPDGIRQMLQEMARVTRSRIILTARVRDHKFAVTEELILEALKGWRITRNVAGVDLNYRIIELSCS